MPSYPLKRTGNKIFVLLLFVMPLLVFATGCHRDEIKVYRIARDQDQLQQQTAPTLPTDSPNPAMPPGHPDISSAPTAGAPAAADQSALPQLTWKTPEGWTEVPPSEMRVASFTVTNANGQTADVGVIPLPTAGSELDLVNMWREQMQLPALTNETSFETISVGSDSAKLFNIVSDAPIIDGKFRARILVAELPRGDTSWFFKMTGEDSFAASQKEIFLQFLKSISFEDSTHSIISGANSGAQNILVPNENTTGVGGNSSVEGNQIWTIPSGWQSLPPSQFLVAEFSITGTNGAKANVNVAMLAGEGGGLAANVNRWRGQLGLPTADETDFSKSISTFDVSGGQATLVDLSGTDSKTGQPARLVGAIVPQNGQTWFYKLMGDGQIVAAQKDAFIKFIQSANYSNAR